MESKLSLSEKLAYSTVRIQCKLKNGDISTGTGFFYRFAESEGTHIPAIITNKHVIKDAELGKFNLNLSINGNTAPSTHITFSFDNFENFWICHPDNKVDLCVMPIAPLVTEAERSNKKLFFLFLDKSLIPSEEELNNLTLMEDIIMVGYPNGIWDEVNNMPIFRRGITATHPNLNWNGKPEFLIDAACFPGSSGSPVFLFNMGSYPVKSGGIVIGSRLKLLGVLYAGPQHTVTGEIEIVTVPTRQLPVVFSNIPNNLGVVIKSEKLNDFEPIFEEMLKKQG